MYRYSDIQQRAGELRPPCQAKHALNMCFWICDNFGKHTQVVCTMRTYAHVVKVMGIKVVVVHRCSCCSLYSRKSDNQSRNVTEVWGLQINVVTLDCFWVTFAAIRYIADIVLKYIYTGYF